MDARIVNHQERSSKLLKATHRLEAQRDLLISQKAETLIEISNSNSYLETKDEVSDFLAKIQAESQQKTKGMYEDLLTSLIKEVLPDKKDRIVFSTSIKNNKLALDIDIQTTKKLLNVKKDKGGSIQNIVALGLRFITVSRSRNRKILLLDEADQSLNIRQIPKFASIIKQLSEQLNVQVIYITHHNPEAFEDCAKVVSLKQKNNIIYVASDNESDFDEDDIGIRYARLINFKQHTNTLINFSKHVTVITGEVDIGKSSIIEAFSVVMNNEGREALIKDDTNGCSVELGMEEGRSLKFEYSSTGSNKTKYSVIESNGEISETSIDGRNIPSWLDSYLATPKLGDFDIHISRQMDSNFILDESFSSQKRAEILSLENESEQIQKMISLHSERIRFHKSNINTMNKRLNGIKNSLEKLALLNHANNKLEKHVELLNKAIQGSDLLKRITETGKKFNFYRSRIQILTKVRNISTGCSSVDITSTSNLRDVIVSLVKAEKIKSNLENISKVKDINIPPLEDLGKITETGKKIAKFMRKISILSPIRNVAISDLANINDVSGFGVIHKLESASQKHCALSLVKNIIIPEITAFSDCKPVKNHIDNSDFKTKIVIDLKDTLSSVNKELTLVESEEKSLIEQLGSKCPLCESHINSGCKHE